MPDFICTTIIEYADRYEGQIMHRGDRESCDKMAEMIPAVAVSGDDTPVGASTLVAPAAEFGDMECGQLWRNRKG